MPFFTRSHSTSCNYTDSFSLRNIEAFVFRFTSRLRGSKHFLEPRRREVREEGQRIVLVNSH